MVYKLAIKSCVSFSKMNDSFTLKSHNGAYFVEYQSKAKV